VIFGSGRAIQAHSPTHTHEHAHAAPSQAHPAASAAAAKPSPLFVNMNASEPVAQITQMFADHVSLPTIGGGSKLDPASSSYSNVRPSAISKGSSRTSSSGKDLKSYRFDQKAPEAKGPKVYSPSEALSKYGKCLTPYEQEEIKQFQQIFFVGQKARKINAGEGKGKNFGYDDDKGRYKCVKGDHMSYRYEVMKGLGKGSFGDVVKAHDHKTNTDVALKIIRNEKRFHKQAQYEIKILDLLKRQDKRNTHNVIHMKDFFLFRGHLCLSFEMMACDMYAALKRNDFKGFSLSTIRGYCTPLITALRVLRRSRIIHCDLKPENILMKHPDDTALKIIDFGSSCFDHEKVHSYIQSASTAPRRSSSASATAPRSTCGASAASSPSSTRASPSSPATTRRSSSSTRWRSSASRRRPSSSRPSAATTSSPRPASPRPSWTARTASACRARGRCPRPSPARTSSSSTFCRSA